MDTATGAAGPYSIGSDQWPGLSRLIEEAGELLQAAGKLIGSGGERQHYSGTDLGQTLADELADTLAAIRYFRAHNARLVGPDCDVTRCYIDDRTDEKFRQYQLWHWEANHG
jgi:hypothetical protein